MAEKYYSWSPYVYCMNNPILNIDPRGDSTRVYTETQGVGHAWLSIGEGKDMIVYSFMPNDKSMIKANGILIKYQGKKGQEYIDKKIKETQDVVIATIADVSDHEVNNEVQTIIENSVVARIESDDNGSIHYFKTENDYNLLKNNCTTFVTNVLNNSGSKIMHGTTLQQTSTFGTWSTVPTVSNPIMPSRLRSHLRTK